MGKRLAVSIEAAFVLFVIPAAIALFVLRKVPGLNIAIYSLVLFVPALASVILVVLSGWFRSLLVQPKITFPVALTFPIIHGALMLVIVRIAATTSAALETIPPKLAPAIIWEHWGVLIACVLLNFVALNVIAAIGGGA